MQLKVALAAGLVLATALSGCFGAAPPAPPPEIERPAEIDEEAFGRLEQLAAPEIRNYTLPGSQRLPSVVQWFNGTIGPEANAAYQDRNMRGGNDLGVVLTTFPIDSLVPVGQPTALRVKMHFFGSPGSSAAAHIYVCVPGTCTYYTTNNNDQFNWKATVETRNVMTIGVNGFTPVVGVAAANGLITDPLDFYLEVQATYFSDVLTPVNAYAFQVPPGATGVTLKSVKPGQEHLQARFIVLDPQDELVAYQEYDDIAVVSESIFIPTRQPGEYVFYAQEMHNGFFTIVSDAPLGEGNNTLRVLPITESGGPLAASGAPGMVERDFVGDPLGLGTGGTPTPYTSGSTANFNVDQGFPVEVAATIGDGFTGAAEIRIMSAKGEVYRLQRVLRLDQEQGSLGYTRDEANTLTNWANLAKGAYTVEIVNDGVTGEMAYVVKTYTR